MRCIKNRKRTLNAFVSLVDLTAILLLVLYILIFHLLSLGSFLFEGKRDEQIVMKLSEWLLPIITMGSLIYFYIKYLNRVEYKKLKSIS
jgi:hypothetical protein